MNKPDASIGRDLPAPHEEPHRFTFLNPDGGEIYRPGSHVAIYWTGGPTLPQTVDISLVDIQAWRVVVAIVGRYENVSPIGKYVWTIPAGFPFDPTHDYQVYIEDSARTTWTYGPQFKIP